jgi:hypothetical protein
MIVLDCDFLFCMIWCTAYLLSGSRCCVGSSRMYILGLWHRLLRIFAFCLFHCDSLYRGISLYLSILSMCISCSIACFFCVIFCVMVRRCCGVSFSYPEIMSGQYPICFVGRWIFPFVVCICPMIAFINDVFPVPLFPIIAVQDHIGKSCDILWSILCQSCMIDIFCMLSMIFIYADNDYLV